MIPHKLNYTIKRTLESNMSQEQMFLRQTTGKKFTKKEAEFLWKHIENHKWNISEKLNRDVGLQVAAIDYFENFFDSQSCLTT